MLASAPLSINDSVQARRDASPRTPPTGHNRERMSAASRSPRPGLLPTLLLLLALAAVACPCAARGSTDNPKQAAARARLEAVKKQIAELTRKQHDAATRRDTLSAELSKQARALDAAARAVHESDRAIAAKRNHLAQLDARQKPIRARLDRQRQALAELLRAAYALGRGTDLRLLLGDDDVARIGRALAYSQYFQRDRIRRIRSLMQDLTQLQALQQQVAAQKKALESERAQRQARLKDLDRARRHQHDLLAQVKATLDKQGRQLKQLERNRRNLDRLVKRLGNVFADIPGKLPDDTPFARRKGHLPWPVHGRLRSSGNGVTIDARRGSTVRAVAHGRVAFANWLRGYGMLIIVDHGNGWMSLYGDNESLQREVGDWVNAGDSLGTAGIEAGGHEGVFFGLRHHGKPVNPRPWLSRRR
jgi:murein hydrolase activator